MTDVVVRAAAEGRRDATFVAFYAETAGPLRGDAFQLLGDRDLAAGGSAPGRVPGPAPAVAARAGPAAATPPKRKLGVPRMRDLTRALAAAD